MNIRHVRLIIKREYLEKLRSPGFIIGNGAWCAVVRRAVVSASAPEGVSTSRVLRR